MGHGAADAKAVTRATALADPAPGPKLLSVFGGKITTARALAQEALDRLGVEGRRSTSHTFLPGGDLYPDFVQWLDALARWMPQPLVARLSSAYGTRLRDMLGDATGLADLGRISSRPLPKPSCAGSATRFAPPPTTCCGGHQAGLAISSSKRGGGGMAGEPKPDPRCYGPSCSGRPGLLHPRPSPCDFLLLRLDPSLHEKTEDPLVAAHRASFAA